MMITREEYIQIKEKERVYQNYLEVKRKEINKWFFYFKFVVITAAPTIVGIILGIFISKGYFTLFLVSVVFGMIFGVSYNLFDYMSFDKYWEKKQTRKEYNDRINKLKQNAKERQALIAMYEAEEELKRDVESRNKSIANDFIKRLEKKD